MFENLKQLVYAVYWSIRWYFAGASVGPRYGWDSDDAYFRWINKASAVFGETLLVTPSYKYVSKYLHKHVCVWDVRLDSLSELDSLHYANYIIDGSDYFCNTQHPSNDDEEAKIKEMVAWAKSRGKKIYIYKQSMRQASWLPLIKF
jgi:hypothetical protein